MDAPTPSPMSERRYRALVAALVVAAAVVLVVGILVTDTDEREDPQSDAVEHLIPEPNDEVIRQAELGVDLAPGFDGTLVVNGEEIPEEDQRRVPEQNQVFFTPGEGKAVERLLAGPNCVMAVVWKAAQGRGTNDQTVTWCFQAT